MRIAVDARELLGQSTGVGRYLTGVLNAWRESGATRSHEVTLCAPAALPFHAEGVTALIDPGMSGGGRGTAWEQLTLPRLVRRARADVLFAPAYTAPLLCPAPVVLAVHDVSFFAHPEWYGGREGIRRRALARLSARRAARVVTISEHSRGEIERWVRVPRSHVGVVYPGVTSLAPPATNGRENLVLFVGSIFGRRHVRELIQGFGELARQHADVTLEIVGDNRTRPREDFAALVASSRAAERMTLRSYVPEATLATLFGRARAFAFLSEYEGFGLPPAEALAAGIPIVVLDTPVAREVFADAAVYLPRPDPALIRDALERLLFDHTERARILEASRAVLPKYSWSTCAAALLDMLIAAADRRDAS